MHLATKSLVLAPVPVVVATTTTTTSSSPHVFRVRRVRSSNGGEDEGVLLVNETGLQWWKRKTGQHHAVVEMSNGNEQVEIGPGPAEWTVAWRQIVLHAVCSDLDAYPEPCIFCQIESENGEEDETEDVRLCPARLEDLRKIFDVMSRFSASCSMPGEDGEDDDDEDELGEGMMGFIHGGEDEEEEDHVENGNDERGKFDDV